MSAVDPHIVHILATAALESVPLELAGAMSRSDRARVSVVVVRPSATPPEVRNIVVQSRVGQLPTTLRRLRPDVVHVHHGVVAFLGALSARLVGVPLIVKTEHRDRYTYGLLRRVLNMATLVLCDVIICNSESTKRTFARLEQWLLRQPVLVIYNGVDIDRIDRAPRADAPWHGRWPNGIPVLGIVARLVPYKDHATLFRAIATLKARHVRVGCAVIGDGPLRHELAALVEQLQLNDAVTFVGRLPDRDAVYSALHCLDLFVIPSRSSEGFCNAAVEAMAANLPVIAARGGALPEVTGGCAVLVPVHDPVPLADAIERTLAERPTGQSGPTAGRQRACELYSLTAAVERHLSTYATYDRRRRLRRSYVTPAS
ncbi:MAG: glycosyltransferase [Luteitalea sp.]|nr:glycosyltransferase [Luteitalea sp.]